MKPLFERRPDGRNIFNVPEKVINKILDAAAAEGQDVRAFLEKYSTFTVIYDRKGITLMSRIENGKIDSN